MLWALAAIVYLALFFWLGLTTLRNGHGCAVLLWHFPSDSLDLRRLQRAEACGYLGSPQLSCLGSAVIRRRGVDLPSAQA